MPPCTSATTSSPAALRKLQRFARNEVEIEDAAAAFEVPRVAQRPVPAEEIRRRAAGKAITADPPGHQRRTRAGPPTRTARSKPFG